MASSRRRSDGRELRLWAGVLVAPATWGLSLLVSYAVVAERCSPALTLTLTVVTAFIAAGGAALALMERRRLAAAHDDDAAAAGSAGRQEEAAARHHEPGTRSRQLLMGKAGFILGVLMTIAIAAHGISLVIIGCR